MPSSDIIQLLPDSIANQIAAGEVVQRPASVVKELLENAIDAQATSIQVILKEAGRTLIQIIDNGAGMTQTDARMSFERHATSKIRQSDDLFKIRTMGFRGEALASIAAVAQVELKTKTEEDELGTLIRIEASEIKAQEAIACETGTSFSVKNLFFNVPARRNFLKSNSVEMRHVLDEFQRIALAHPDVSLTLFHNDTEIFNLQAGKLVRRIIDIFGKSYREQLAFCQEETSYINVRGFIGKPEYARKTRGEQYFFVNDRFIKHSYMHHAVLNAFDGTIPDGSHPFYVLFIEIDPAHIDINIHPTKTEIKFDDEKSVYAILMAAVKKAVGVYNLSQSIDFDDNINFLNPGSTEPSQGSAPRAVTPDWAAQSHKPGDSHSKSNLTNWNKLFEGLQSTDGSAGDISSFETSSSGGSRPSAYLEQSRTVASKVNRMASEVIAAPESDAITFQLHNRYILSQVKDGIMLIDQKAAYERILFERYRRMLSNRNGACQQLLFPKTIRVSPSDMQLVQETREQIRSLGFEFDEFGTNQLIIRGIPADLPEESEQDLFEELLEQLKQSYSDLKLKKLESLSRSLARRFAVRYAVKLSTLEIHTLINQLFASTDPNRTPGGEAIIVLLTMDKLATIFK
ncbi:DNA mismatch repair endonuclease MutL [Dyadobacter tibetensis]|uniref:DNA mismatch repair endonuclease MutL n=1 Tax=Dyadobacter tibetensis TaxID=1211851 RepID=UPI00046F081C|nr:DNA mismatch repair endonuclease MutL [Dyadobacter tibetensis]